MNGKGDRDRTADRKKFNESYDRIFRDKKKAKPIKAPDKVQAS